MSGDPWPELAAELAKDPWAAWAAGVDPWAAALADIPYFRPGHPGMLLTRGQWDNYDAWNELQDRQERKYGALRQRAGLAPVNLVRGIW